LLLNASQPKGSAHLSDPFSILGVDENATDEEIKQRYLAMVRAYPPDREPARFQVYRAAYEALCNERKRLEIKLLAANAANDAALTRLKIACLPAAEWKPGRASQASVTALLVEGIEQATAHGREPPGEFTAGR
jgi:curved DNA-binding protein CbpA